jgi:hypothetical protein
MATYRCCDGFFHPAGGNSRAFATARNNDTEGTPRPVRHPALPAQTACYDLPSTRASAQKMQQPVKWSVTSYRVAAYQTALSSLLFVTLSLVPAVTYGAEAGMGRRARSARQRRRVQRKPPRIPASCIPGGLFLGRRIISHQQVLIC